MTVGEIMMIGENVGKKHVDEIAEQIVKDMIAARMAVYKRRLHEADYKSFHKGIREKISILEKAESMDFYKVLVNETRNRMINYFRQVADNTNIDLSNAEYFGFTGRLR